MTVNNTPVPYRGEERRPALSPFEEPRRFLREMDRLFRTWPFLDGFDAFVPPADVSETDSAYLFELDLPGVEKGDVTIEALGGRLSVHGQRREGERKSILSRRGRVTGEFRYEWSLPEAVDTERITARLESGVLTVEVPKSEGARPRSIPIA